MRDIVVGICSILGFIILIKFYIHIKKFFYEMETRICEKIASKILIELKGNIIHKEDTPLHINKELKTSDLDVVVDDTNINYFSLEDHLDEETIKKVIRILNDDSDATIKLELGMGDLKKDSGTITELFCGAARIVDNNLKDFFNFLAYHKDESKDIPYKFVNEAEYDTFMKVNHLIVPVKIILHPKENNLPLEERRYIIEIQRREENVR